jgi:hypothetical protein
LQQLKPESNPIQELYDQYKGINEPSVSSGTVSNGSLKNGKLFPFKGPNFIYFDSTSYLSKHAFTNDQVYQTVLATYQQFESTHFPSFNSD